MLIMSHCLELDIYIVNAMQNLLSVLHFQMVYMYIYFCNIQAKS